MLVTGSGSPNNWCFEFPLILSLVGSQKGTWLSEELVPLIAKRSLLKKKKWRKKTGRNC